MLPRYGGAAARKYRRASDPHLSIDRHTYTPTHADIKDIPAAVESSTSTATIISGVENALAQTTTSVAISCGNEDIDQSPQSPITQDLHPFEQLQDGDGDGQEDHDAYFTREELVALRLMFSLFDR